MAQLYGKCFDNNIIKQAINFVLNKIDINEIETNDISIKNLPDYNIILKQVKMLLRRCKTAYGKIYHQKLICNLYNIIAQYCIYIIIMPIINKHISNNSYDLKENINQKIPVSKICAKVINSKHVFTIEFDFEYYLNSIEKERFINESLDMLRILGVTDGKLLRTIKHLMFMHSKDKITTEYLKTTILGKVLANCYLSKIDYWIENNIDIPSKHFVYNFNKHKDDYIQWLYNHNKKPAGKYYRYYDKAILLINTRIEQLTIYHNFNNNFNNSQINIKLNYNKFDFLGYHIIRRIEYDKAKIGITPSNPKQINQLLRLTKWTTYQDICKSLNIIIELLNKYDICNNMKFYLNTLGLRIMKIARRKNSILQKVKNKVEYTYIYNNLKYTINIYTLRKLLKISYKYYLINPIYLVQKDNINKLNIHAQAHHIFKWALWVKQKGKDPITLHNLNPKYLHIHHINGNHNDNRISNLLLISPNTHKMIHTNIDTNNTRLLKYRKYLYK